MTQNKKIDLLMNEVMKLFKEYDLTGAVIICDIQPGDSILTRNKVFGETSNTCLIEAAKGDDMGYDVDLDDTQQVVQTAVLFENIAMTAESIASKSKTFAKQLYKISGTEATIYDIDKIDISKGLGGPIGQA